MAFSASSRQAEWHWNNEGSWDKYDDATTRQIETAFLANQPNVQLNEGYFRRRRGQYEIRFDYRRLTAVQVNTRTNFRRDLRRTPDMSQREIEPPALTRAQITAFTPMFERFRDPEEPDAIGGDGLVNLMNELRMDPNGKLGLTLFWKFKCEDMGYISQDEFMNGMNRLGCRNINDLRKAFQRVEQDLRDPAVFRKFYKFIFDVTRNGQESNKKTIGADMALGLIQVLLGDMYADHVARFQTYLQDVVLAANENERINSDQWMSLLEFFKTVNVRTMAGYEDDGAWPVLIDEYVEWAKEN